MTYTVFLKKGFLRSLTPKLLFLSSNNIKNRLNDPKIRKATILKRTGPSYEQKYVFSDNLLQNIWDK